MNSTGLGPLLRYAAGGASPFFRMGMRPNRPSVMPMPRVHTGPISGPTGGRADHRPLSVKAGSYVVPSAVVSHLGGGNTLMGNRVLEQMFSGGPYGTKLQRPAVRGPRLPTARAPAPPRFADGGAADEVPIQAADGEFIIPPETVTAIGAGDMNRGHAALDEWVRLELKNAAKTIANLPGPRQR